MNMILTAKVPVKPYLLKFVEYVESLAPGEPLNVNNGGALAYSLMLLASTKNELRKASTKSYYGIESELTAHLTFTINSRMQSWNRMFWHRDSVVQINTFLFLQFHEYLLQRIREEQRVNPQKQIKQIIFEWLQLMEIDDDDIGYDSVERQNRRFREKKYKNLLRADLFAAVALDNESEGNA